MTGGGGGYNVRKRCCKGVLRSGYGQAGNEAADSIVVMRAIKAPLGRSRQDCGADDCAAPRAKAQRCRTVRASNSELWSYRLGDQSIYSGGKDGKLQDGTLPLPEMLLTVTPVPEAVMLELESPMFAY